MAIYAFMQPLESKSSRNSNNNEEEGDDDAVPLAWEIYNPQTFFGLSLVEKRAILRASGVTRLPRPRMGVKAIDDLLLGE